jgi:hypothetical protein
MSTCISRAIGRVQPGINIKRTCGQFVTELVCTETYGALIVYSSGIQPLFVRVPPDAISLQLCTPKVVDVYNSSYTTV